MKYDLVFQGGGARGMVLVGAYAEFVRRGHTPGRLLGTSAGAITATLIAAGYTPDEMQSTLEERENEKPVFAGFLGNPSPFSEPEIRASAIRTLFRNIDLKFIPDLIEERIDEAITNLLFRDPFSRHLASLIERGGWYDADRFVSWLETRLNSGMWQGRPRQFGAMSMAEFFAATQVELSVVAADTTDGRLLVLNHNTAPNCPLVWAVRMSMSIPLIWQEVIWLPEWGTYLGRDLAGHTIVDGGILSNFPLELFISDAPHVTRLMGPKQNTPVLGLLIDGSLPVPQLLGGAVVDVNTTPQDLRTVQRIGRLMDTAMNAHDNMVIEAFNHLVVRLPVQGYGVVEFDMSDERRAALVAAGNTAMSDYFDRQPPLVLGGADTAEALPPVMPVVSIDRVAMRMLEQEPQLEAERN